MPGRARLLEEFKRIRRKGGWGRKGGLSLDRGRKSEHVVVGCFLSFFSANVSDFLLSQIVSDGHLILVN